MYMYVVGKRLLSHVRVNVHLGFAYTVVRVGEGQRGGWKEMEGEYAGRLEEMEGVGWGGGGKREKWTEGLIVEFIIR